MELNLHRGGPDGGETLVLLHGIGSRWRATLAGSARIARGLAALAPQLMRRPRMRALLCATFFAHPTQIPPSVAAADLRALAGAPWFDATLRTTLRRPQAAPDDVAAPVTE